MAWAPYKFIIQIPTICHQIKKQTGLTKKLLMRRVPFLSVNQPVTLVHQSLKSCRLNRRLKHLAGVIKRHRAARPAAIHDKIPRVLPVNKACVEFHAVGKTLAVRGELKAEELGGREEVDEGAGSQRWRVGDPDAGGLHVQRRRVGCGPFVAAEKV